MFHRIVFRNPPGQREKAVGMAFGSVPPLSKRIFWITAKIFRLGLLATGKRPTIPELWRWLKVV